MLHYGKPAENVGCRDSRGQKMWDPQEHRAKAWADAQAAVASYRPSARQYLFACAEQAKWEDSSHGLDKLEARLLGEVVTGGTYPKRQRFWRFVVMISQGVCPRDLQGSV